jgi:hypothetical protein
VLRQELWSEENADQPFEEDAQAPRTGVTVWRQHRRSSRSQLQRRGTARPRGRSFR